MMIRVFIYNLILAFWSSVLVFVILVNTGSTLKASYHLYADEWSLNKLGHKNFDEVLWVFPLPRILKVRQQERK